MRFRPGSYPAILVGFVFLVVIGRAVGPLDRTAGGVLLLLGIAAMLTFGLIGGLRWFPLCAYLPLGLFVLIPAGDSFLPGRFGNGHYSSPIVMAMGVPAMVGMARVTDWLEDERALSLDQQLKGWLRFFCACGGLMLLAVPLMVAVDAVSGRSPGPIDAEWLTMAAIGFVTFGVVSYLVIGRLPEERQRAIFG